MSDLLTDTDLAAIRDWCVTYADYRDRDESLGDGYVSRESNEQARALAACIPKLIEDVIALTADRDAHKARAERAEARVREVTERHMLAEIELSHLRGEEDHVGVPRDVLREVVEALEDVFKAEQYNGGAEYPSDAAPILKQALAALRPYAGRDGAGEGE